MIRLAVSALALLVLAPTAATACDYLSYQDSGIVIHADHLAERMVDAATTVDLVEIGSIDPWDTVARFATWRAQAIAEARPEWVPGVNARYDREEAQYRNFGASTVTFRVIERLKGSGTDGFSFEAFVGRPGEEGFFRADLVDHIPKVAPLPTGEDLYMQWIVDLVEFQSTGSCSTPLVVTEGNRYLVFRDANGGLLRGAVPVTDSRQPPVRAVDGPVFETVTGDDDVWLAAVRAASLR